MKIDNLILFQKMYDFSLWLIPHTEKFPKSQRFALAKSVNDITINVLTAIVNMNFEKNNIEKEKKIDSLNLEIDKLRILLRLSKDLKYISIKQYEYAELKLDEVGKITGGFRKGDKS